MTLQHDKQDIIHAILARYLNDLQLQHAMTLWHNQYRHKPLQDLKYFVFEIADSAKLRTQRNRIEQDLQQELQKLPADAQTATREKTAETKTANQKTSANTLSTATAKVVDNAVLLVDKTDVQAMNQLFADLLQVLKGQQGWIMVIQEYWQENDRIEPYQQDFLAFCLEADYKPAEEIFLDQHMPKLFYQQEILRQAINAVYAVICEYVGAVKADRHLAHCIARVERQYPLVMIKQYL